MDRQRERRPIVVGARVTYSELKALRALAQAEERTPSDVLRRLIRQAAQARGLPEAQARGQGVGDDGQ